MARPLWKGTLGFGLVSIPIEIVPAVRDVGPHFHFLRESDRSRINFKKVAAKDNHPVDNEDIVRGYEYGKGRYVVLTAEDFKAAAVKRNSAIQLLDFVPADDVDDRYFDKPYYLLPSKGGERAYALLRDTLAEAGRVGIAKIVMRDTPHLAAVEVIGPALVLSTMRFKDELIPASTYEFPRAATRAPERRMARQLIDGLAAEWKPEKYTNEYRANLLSIIAARQKHSTPKLKVQEPNADADVVDLMERLRASLDSAGPSKRRVVKKTATRKETGRKGPLRRTRARSKRRAA